MLLRMPGVVQLAKGVYGANETRGELLSAVETSRFGLDTAVDIGSADGTKDASVGEKCAAIKHPYKCLVELGAKSGCAWSYHPNCGPQVGSCVAWSRSKVGGIDTEYESCKKWKTAQTESGKTGACPESKGDIKTIVDKLWCGKGVPEELVKVEAKKQAEFKKPPATCKEGDVQVAEGSSNQPEVPMYVEVNVGGKFAPICGHYFWNNEKKINWGARLVCRRLGWSGGSVVQSRVELGADASHVGQCGRKDEGLNKCTKAANAFKNFNFKGGWCKKGNKVGVQVKCGGKKGAKGASMNSCGNFMDCWGNAGPRKCSFRIRGLFKKYTRQNNGRVNSKCGWNWKESVHYQGSKKGITPRVYLFRVPPVVAVTKDKNCEAVCNAFKLNCVTGEIIAAPRGTSTCIADGNIENYTAAGGKEFGGCYMKGVEKSACSCGLLKAESPKP